MFAMYGRVCHLCGHDGAGEADHLVPLATNSTQPLDPRTMRPAHGIKSRCPHCPGQPACNQVRGNRPLETTFKPKLVW